MSRSPVRTPLALFLAMPLMAALAQNADSTVSSIETLIRSRDFGKAQAMIQSRLRTSPRDHRFWTLEGIVDSLAGKTAGASRAFETALRLSPDDPAALRGEAQILYQTQDKRAIPLLERILAQDPHDNTAHEMLATLYERQGNCQSAVEHFALVGNVIGSHPASLEAWGKCLIQLGRPGEAVPVFQQLSAAVPQGTWPRYDLAVALVESKQYAAATTILDPLVSATQPDPDTLRLASDAYEETGNTPKAVALVRQAIVLNPADPSYYVAFTALCLNHESFQVGVDMLNIGIRHVPSDSSLHIARGLLYAQMAQYDKAESDFREAERLDATQSLSSYAIDLADLQRNKPDEAIARVRVQLRTHPQSALLHYLLARLLWSQGNQTGSAAMAEAKRHASTAVAIKPDLTEARDLLADIDIAASRYADAEAQCRLALHQDPADQTAIYHLIVALRHTEQGRASNEISGLVTRLSSLQQQSLEQATARKHFSLVETKVPAN